MSPNLPSAAPDRTALREASADPATVNVSADSTNPRLPDPPVGAPVIPGYTITGEIARGGMGCVYAGRESTLDREVAIKTLLPQANAERFVTESKITAKLPHPNVPPVYALGTLADGSPYLAMKLIRGRTLADELKARAAVTTELPRFLQIFEQIAQAVGFAHAQGIIHRDLKPANVMVGEFGEVQVMDWGLAKHQANRKREHQPQGTDSQDDQLTQAGAVMGTPAYMAPEQARGEAVDSRADVFALGGILTAILTGKAVFSGTTARETVTRAASGDTAESLARLDACGADAELVQLAKQCLAISADQRPMDGQAIAKLVAAYRHGVDERLKQAETERASSLVREAEQRKRRRVLVWAGSVVVAVLLLGMAGTGIGLVVANEARGREKDRADGEERARFAEQKAKEDEKLHRTKAEYAYDKTADVLDAMTSEIAGDSLSTQEAMSAEQKKFLREVLKYYQEFSSVRADDEKSKARTAMATSRVGLIEFRLGRLKNAHAAYALAREMFNSLVTDYPTVHRYAGSAALMTNNVARIQKDLGELNAAEREYRAAVAAIEKSPAAFESVSRHQSELARVYYNLGELLRDLGRLTEAQTEHRRGLTLREALTARHPAVSEYEAAVAASRMSLANLAGDLGRLPEAADGYKKVLNTRLKLVAAHPSVRQYRIELAVAHDNLGNTLAQLGRTADAEEHLGKAITQFRSLASEYPGMPEFGSYLAKSHDRLGNFLADLGRAEPAETEYRKGVSVLERLAAEYQDTPQYRSKLADNLNNVGLHLARTGKRKEAERDYKTGLEILAKLTAEYPHSSEYKETTAVIYSNLGALHSLDSGRHADAKAELSKAIELQVALVAEFPSSSTHHDRLAASHSALGVFLVDLEQTAEGERELLKAFTIWKKLATDHPDVPEHRFDQARCQLTLGELLAARNKPAEAERTTREAIDLLKQLVAAVPAMPTYARTLANGYTVLGDRYGLEGKSVQAEREYDLALATLEKLAASFPGVAEVQVDLAGCYGKRAGRHLERQQPNECVIWMTKAVDTLTPAVRPKVGETPELNLLRVCHRGRAEAFGQLGDHVAATRDWDKVIELNKAEDPEDRLARALSRCRTGKVTDAIAEVEGLLRTKGEDFEFLYNIACAYAVAAAQEQAEAKRTYADRAMQLLQKAVKLGYKEAGHMKKDTDLDPLREREDFKKLLAELEKKFPPMKEVAPKPPEKK